ncbi:MAG: hypothetical protein HY443_00085 [Candidatus Nealsonbacteria bacterium]|nr:hypothetical protein [Candidatus Nealsonbacteria bacterium]
MKASFLRRKYPKFIYEKYSYKISGNNLEIFFDFRIEPGINFQPKIVIEKIDKKRLAKIGDRALDNLVFHLGLIEMPSYWKTTCSPVIEVRAGHLDRKQIKWWKKLFIDGLGQFYFENKIDWRPKNFLEITCFQQNGSDFREFKLKDRYLVPFAGGRDSIVTLEDLKKKKEEIALFTVNPIEKIQKAVKISRVKKQIIVRRIIDKSLLKLNKRGYLNGHTPFTSLLSFLAALCAVIFDYRNIVFSNEKSANEGNVEYLGKNINHQWAKSSEFEKMFSSYARKYLAENLNCFSHLRKYGELEISQMLTWHPQYFPVFSSCNAGMRIGKEGHLIAKERWCGNCPKCLFVYLSLYPFLSEKELNLIFGKNIFENKNLLPILQGLLGQRSVKPFECVGTRKESLLAFKLSLAKAKKGEKLPFLLKKLS